MSQAYFQSTIRSFLHTDKDEIVGKLNLANTQFAFQWTITSKSWDNSIEILKNALTELVYMAPLSKDWNILLEYEIPRLGKRIDIVIIAVDIIFVIEFKLDRKEIFAADTRQVEDYVMDLSDFHLESQGRVLIPILLAPLSKEIQLDLSKEYVSKIIPCSFANSQTLSNILNKLYHQFHNDQATPIDPNIWEQSKYQPTPTIVQAARALFAGQKVENITRWGAENLEKTTQYLLETISFAKKHKRKVICFVTGVPGAGKTLVGLSVVHQKSNLVDEKDNASYFSGNIPLINVLREALIRDQVNQKKAAFESNGRSERPKKGDSEREVKTKIQNLHLFIKDSIRSNDPPNESIVVFDEAQRCWNAEHFFNKAKQNLNREKDNSLILQKSEAELILEIMDRHHGSAVIIALVGGGQEINTGEGGISEWGKAISTRFGNWEVHVSPNLLKGDFTITGQMLFDKPVDSVIIHENSSLHLSVSQRSFRAANLNSWVNAVLENKSSIAFDLASEIKPSYELKVTRNIEIAKSWLKKQRAGSKRIGLVASSGALRLKPYGVFVREVVEEALWFLNEPEDVRSSHYLEITATEYKVQGLELDWVGVCWDGDLRREKDKWDYRNFSGTKWQQVKKEPEQQFLVNTYRVLLTRAREGIVVFVPLGDSEDETRKPDIYTPIYNFLVKCGMDEI